MKRSFFHKLLIPSEANNFQPYLLRKSALAVYTLMLFVFNIILSPMLSLGLVNASTITPDNVIDLTNEERTRMGLPKLTANIQLTAAAYAKAQDMLEKQYWDHFGPNGETPWQFIEGAGYDYYYAGENLAKGFSSAEGMHQAWMASPKHKENIISGRYTDIGVAVVNGQLLGEEVTLVVQMFGNLENDIALPSSAFMGNTGSTPQVVDENGEIKSISITRPEENELINDPAIPIEGQIDGTLSGDEQIDVYDNDEFDGSIDTVENAWSYEKPYDWVEGDHSVLVELRDESGAIEEATVNFTIDSTPPNIDVVNVEKREGTFDVSGLIEEENIDVVLSINSNTFEMSISDDGYFHVEIPAPDSVNSAMILATDDAGNISKLQIPNSDFETESGSVLGSIQIAGSDLSIKQIVNTVFVLFILALVLVEVIYFRKHKDMLHKGHYLSTLSMWGLVAVIQILSSFAGSIV